MTSRLRLNALAAGAFLAAAPHRPPGRAHYRVDVASEQATDATALGGNLQRQAVKVSGFLTLTLADTVGGMTLDAVVDSMTTDSGGAVPPQALQGTAGSTWHGLVSWSGQVGGLTAVRAHPVASIFLEEVLANFYPRTGLTEPTWSDTIETTTTILNGSRTTRTATNYQRGGTERWGSREGLTILSAFSSGVSATQRSPQGTIDLEGNGWGSATQYVAPDGLYLGGVSRDSVSLVATGGSLAQPLPITIVTTITTTLLP